MFDPYEGAADGGPESRRAPWSCPVCGATEDDFLPPEQRRGLGAHFARPSFFSQIVASLQWDPNAIDLTLDARSWPELPAERRRRLTTLLAGFRVGEDAVSQHLTPFATATKDTLVAWVFFLQRRDEERHTVLFDRIAAEVLGLPGATPAERRAAARARAPAAVLELFEVRLPALAAELAAGRTGLDEGVSLYHMVLEGIVFSAGQRALLDDLADGALPGIREGIEHVDLDERWHIGFGLRNLLELQPSAEVLDHLLARVQDATTAWGDAVPAAAREHAARMFTRRLSVVGLIESRAAA